MKTLPHALIPFLACLGGLAGACVAPGEDGDRTEEAETGELASAISASELSILLMGQSFPISHGYAPGGGNAGHAGVDFSGTGDGVTAVRSPVNGTIVANTSACGKVAVFDGANTLIFAHMSHRTSLKVGDAASVGTYLGKASKQVGGGCEARGPHLHLEIRKGNHPTMAAPKANNTATTLDPLAYQYGPFPPVLLVTPDAGASVQTDDVTFEWMPVQGASVYRLQVAGPSGFSGDACADPCMWEGTTSGTQLDVTLHSTGTHYWRVRAGSSYSGGLFSAPRLLLK